MWNFKSDYRNAYPPAWNHALNFCRYVRCKRINLIEVFCRQVK